MEKDTKFAVLGGGSWATAIVKMLTNNQEMVGWYMRNSDAIEHIKTQKHNPNYLTSVEFKTEQLFLTDDINDAVNFADVLIFAVPSAFLVSELKKLKSPLKDKIITGPCHAEEVAMERLSYLTIACADKDKAQLIAKNLSSNYIKTNISKDIIGTEYAAMLKNIYAIAAGIAHGLGYGDNFQSVLMSNAIREMKRYTKRIHNIDRNINKSAYLGDLLVTGYSIFSRNRMFGNMIGKGYTVKSAQMEMSMIAEGYYAAKSAYAIKEGFKKKVKTPIIDAVYQVLYENKNPKKVFLDLTDKLD